MDIMNKDQEMALVSAIEQAIHLSNGGDTPNDAILKVATDKGFDPETIKRMVEIFNKSKSVHMLKAAQGDARAATFDIADTSEILKKMFAMPEKTASEFCLSSRDFSKEGLRVGGNLLEKIAALRVETLSGENPASTLRRLELYASTCSKVQEKLYTEAQLRKYAFEKELDNASELLRPLLREELTKVAQLIVNGYPTTGSKLIAILQNKANVPLPVLTKTANAAVFPAKEPYLTIGRVYETADAFVKAERELKSFEKEAVVGQTMLSRFLSNAASNAVATVGGIETAELQQALTTKPTKEDLVEDLSPQFHNRMKELEAKRAFMNLALYDPDLKNYKYSDLIKAYNNSVQMVPASVENPTMLKNLMHRNLQTSGVMDLFELGQLGKTQESAQAAKLNAEKLRLLQEQALMKEPSTEETGTDKGKAGAKTDKKGDGVVSKVISAREKQKQKAEEEAKKRQERADAEEVAAEVAAEKAKDQKITSAVTATANERQRYGISYQKAVDALNRYVEGTATQSDNRAIRQMGLQGFHI